MALLGKLAVAALTALVLAIGAAIAIASGGGWDHGHPGNHQYKPPPHCPPKGWDHDDKNKGKSYGWDHDDKDWWKKCPPKPGCGPDKNDGHAGNSGRHSGQPPKDHNRGDCPDPPGQCKDKRSYGGHHDDGCKPDCDDDKWGQSHKSSYGGHDDDCKPRCDDKKGKSYKSSYGGHHGDDDDCDDRDNRRRS